MSESGINWFDDMDEILPDFDVREDFIDRVEEAQKAIAWAADLYEGLYGKLPEGTWSQAMDELVKISQQFKKELADET